MGKEKEKRKEKALREKKQRKEIKDLREKVAEQGEEEEARRKASKP